MNVPFSYTHPSTGVTRCQRYYGPLGHPGGNPACGVGPGLSLAGVRLRVNAPSPLGVSRVALDLRVPTCRRHYPGGPLGSDRSWDGLFHPFPIHPQRRRPSPSECEVGVHIGRFEACSTFTRVTACRLAASPERHICLEGSDGFVTSNAAPIATGWSDPVAGWELHPLETNTFSRRTLGLTPPASTPPASRNGAGDKTVGSTPGPKVRPVLAMIAHSRTLVKGDDGPDPALTSRPGFLQFSPTTHSAPLTP